MKYDSSQNNSLHNLFSVPARLHVLCVSYVCEGACCAHTGTREDQWSMSGVFLYRVLPTFWDSLSHGICSFLPELHWLASELSPQDPPLSIPTLNAGATQVYAQLSWVLAILTQILVLAQQSFLYNELYLPLPTLFLREVQGWCSLSFYFFPPNTPSNFTSFHTIFIYVMLVQMDSILPPLSISAVVSQTCLGRRWQRWALLRFWERCTLPLWVGALTHMLPYSPTMKEAEVPYKTLKNSHGK